jgi:DNA-binding transcriptional regulator YiaG
MKARVWTPERISAFRTSLGMTQREFAEMLDCTEITVRFWERGRTRPSRMGERFLSLLADALKGGAK